MEVRERGWRVGFLTSGFPAGIPMPLKLEFKSASSGSACIIVRKFHRIDGAASRVLAYFYDGTSSVSKAKNYDAGRKTLQQRMVALLSRLAPSEGYNLCAMPDVRFLRSNRPLAATPVLYDPGIVIVCQARPIREDRSCATTHSCHV